MNLEDLPQDQQTVLGAVERYARRAGFPAYLVGGAVRDALLGRRILDVDVAIEGDALAVAREVGNNLPIEVRTHTAFGTAVLTSESGRRVDLAATRSEDYGGVAALPTVRPAPLEQDLVRRDFTVNSMAVPLERPDVEQAIDPSGGRADLEGRLLRVHHPRSFLDDPTRILRGVRFEARLEFELEGETESLARSALAEGALGLVTAERIHTELVLTLSEEVTAGAIWARFADLGVTEALGLDLEADAIAGLVESVRAAYVDWDNHYGDARPIDQPELLLEALTLTRAPEERAVLAERLRVQRQHLMELEALAAKVIGQAAPPHQIAALLGPLADDELLLLTILLGPDGSRVVYEHLDHQRPLELRIDGSTLLARGFEPGPALGQALEATRAARLDGRLTADEELAFAVEWLESEGGE